VDFKLHREQTGGAMSIVEHTVDPGCLIPPHVHRHEDECSYVLEGEIGARIGDQVVQVLAGSFVRKPRGIPHTFWNAGPRPARLIEIITPAGFEQFFVELDELVRGGPSFAEVAKLGARYGLEYHMDWVEELVARYNLKLQGQ